MNFRSYTESQNRRSPVDAEAGDQPRRTLVGQTQDKACAAPTRLQGHVGDKGARFSVYMRQNLTDENDFSCGIAYLPPGGPPLTLARYNGPSHAHDDIVWRPHIHRVTEEAIATGRKPEREAEETDRYETLHGVLACLIDDFNLKRERR